MVPKGQHFNISFLNLLRFQTILAIALVFHHITLSLIGYMLLTHLSSGMDRLIASGDLALLKISFQRKMVICIVVSFPFIFLQFFSKDVLNALIPRFSDEIISKASTFIKYMIPHFVLSKFIPFEIVVNKILIETYMRKVTKSYYVLFVKEVIS